MKCDDVRRQLSLYHVGGLSRRRRAHLAQHLQACADCRQELHALDRTVALLSRLGTQSAPEGTWEAIRSQVVVARRPHRLPRLAVALAFAMMLVIGGLLGLRPGLHSTPVIVPMPRSVEQASSDVQTSLEGHVSAQWVAPVSDPAAVGLSLETMEDHS